MHCHAHVRSYLIEGLEGVALPRPRTIFTTMRGPGIRRGGGRDPKTASWIFHLSEALLKCGKVGVEALNLS